MRRISKREGKPVKISNSDGIKQEKSVEDIYSECMTESSEMGTESRNEIDNLVSKILLESEVSADDRREDEDHETESNGDSAGREESDTDWCEGNESNKRYKTKRTKSGALTTTSKKIKLTRSSSSSICKEKQNAGDEKDSSNRRWRRKLISDCFDASRNLLVCKYCDKGFKDKGNFIHHVRCHENPNLLFQCTLCDHKSVGRHTLMEHMASKHHVDAKGNPLERNIKCHQCSFTCFANFQLKNHVFQKHSKPFSCDKCSYSCASIAVLTRHIKAVHDNERPFMCETCGYRAKTMLVFKRHLKVHSGKKIVCEICGLSLTHQSFRGHMKLHLTDERPHPCQFCSFAARKRYSLKVHLKNVHKLDLESIVQLGKLEPANVIAPSSSSSSSTLPPHILPEMDDGGQQLSSGMCMSQLETIHQMNSYIHTG